MSVVNRPNGFHALHRLRMLIGLAAFFVLACTAYAQPEYLLVLLRNISQSDSDAFLETTYSLQERLSAGLYEETDKRYIMAALVGRMDTHPADRGEIITLLGQLELAEAVPIITPYVHSTDEMMQLRAVQALGWIGDSGTASLLDSLRRDTPTTSPSYVMVDYAVNAVSFKTAFQTASQPERLTMLRQILIEGENALLRVDALRYLRNFPGADVWPVIFDAFVTHSEVPGWQQNIESLLTRRYTFSHEGFITFIRTRSVIERFTALRAIEEAAVTDDMQALMDMAQTDPDEAVSDVANRIVFRMLTD